MANRNRKGLPGEWAALLEPVHAALSAPRLARRDRAEGLEFFLENVKRRAPGFADTDARAVLEALQWARFDAWRQTEDGVGIDEARTALEGVRDADRDGYKARVGLVRAALALYERPGAFTPFRLKPKSARRLEALLVALGREHPEVVLGLDVPGGERALPGAPIIRRGQRGAPLATVRSAARKRLRSAGVPPQWRDQLLRAAGL